MTIRNIAEKSNVITLAFDNSTNAAYFLTSTWRKQPGDYFFVCHHPKKPIGGRAFPRDAFDQVEGYLREHGHENLWWTPGGFNDVYRREEYAENPNWLWADLDEVRVKALRVEPTVVWRTSPRSYQCLWYVRDSGDFDLNKRLSYACARDKGGHGPGKYLRVPFSVNRKPKYDSPLIEVLEKNGPRYTRASLRDALGPWATMSELAMSLLRRDYESGNNRSDHRAKIINQLGREGFDEEEIFDLVWNTPWAGDKEDKLEKDIKRLLHEKPLKSVSSKGVVEITQATDIEPEAIDWMWRGVVPASRPMVINGAPGLGKSQLTCRIAAHVSKGKPWPDGTACPEGKVLFLSAEDAPSDTIVPRLIAAGASLKRCAFIGMTKEGKERRLFDLRADLEGLTNQKAKLLIIDPITSYLGKRDGNAMAQVRELLAYVAEWAHRNECAVITITHPPKATAGVAAINRVALSGAFGAAPRAVWEVQQSEDDPEKRLFLPVKVNISKPMKGWEFTIKGVTVRKTIETSKIVWGAETEKKVDDLPQRKKTWEVVADWLISYVPPEGIWSETLFEAAEEKDFPLRTTRAALEVVCENYKAGEANKQSFYRLLPQFVKA